VFVKHIIKRNRSIIYIGLKTDCSSNGNTKKVWASSMNSILWHRQTPSNSVHEFAHT